MAGPKIRERIRGAAAKTEDEATRVHTVESTAKPVGRPPKGTISDPIKKKAFFLPTSMIQAIQEEADKKFNGNASDFLRDLLRRKFLKKAD